MWGRLRLDDNCSLERNAQLRRRLLNVASVAQQHRDGDLLFQEHMASTENSLVRAFGKYQALGIGRRLVNHDAHEFVRLAKPLLQLLTIVVEVDRVLRDSR